MLLYSRLGHWLSWLAPCHCPASRCCWGRHSVHFACTMCNHFCWLLPCRLPCCMPLPAPAHRLHSPHERNTNHTHTLSPDRTVTDLLVFCKFEGLPASQCRTACMSAAQLGEQPNAPRPCLIAICREHAAPSVQPCTYVVVPHYIPPQPFFLEMQGDNDPVDVVEIGSQACEMGGVYAVKPLGESAAEAPAFSFGVASSQRDLPGG